MPRSPAKSDLVSDGIPNPPWHVVHRSPIHGSGVFAKRKIPPGTRILEYVGEVIDSEEADRRHPVNPDDPFHTFFFAVAGGKVIDGGVRGNEGRYINHSCEPNCEAEETEDGRIFVVALQPIARGEELNYDYGLILEGRHTATLKKQYECRCGAPSCRHTMLAPKSRAAASTAKSKAKGAKTATESKADTKIAKGDGKKGDGKKADTKKAGEGSEAKAAKSRLGKDAESKARKKSKKEAGSQANATDQVGKAGTAKGDTGGAGKAKRKKPRG